MQQIKKKKNTKNIGFLIIAENSTLITFSDIHKIHTQEYKLIMYIMALIYSDSWAEFSFSFFREGGEGWNRNLKLQSVFQEARQSTTFLSH